MKSSTDWDVLDDRGIKTAAALVLLPHHLEHLLPFALLLHATVICFDEQSFVFLRSHFPQVRAIACPLRGSAPETLLSRNIRILLQSFDTILVSTLFSRAYLARAFAVERQRIIFCPHGFSEKQQAWSSGAVFQDISLVYGQYTFDQWSNWDVEGYTDRVVVVGDYSRRFIANALLQTPDGKRLTTPWSNTPLQTVLYAPTWKDRIGSSSVDYALEVLIHTLPIHMQLLIKPHPLVHLSQEQIRLCRSRPNVHIADDWLFSCALFSSVDAYIGDMSSLAYDFLAKNAPMVFLNPQSETAYDYRSSRLFQCGTVVSPTDYSNVYDAIDQEMKLLEDRSARKQALYSYVYTPHQSVEIIQEGLRRELSRPSVLRPLRRLTN